MSNRVVEIGSEALLKSWGDVALPNTQEVAVNTVRLVITALEKEGYKVLAREPTEEMVTALYDFLRGEESAEEATAALHDAAPRYGEPSG